MAFFSEYTSQTTNKSKVQEAFDVAATRKYQQVEKKASETIGAFQNLVDELIKLKELGVGASAKDKITQLTNELNNSSVFFAKVLTSGLGELHTAININDTGTEEKIG